MSNPHPDRPIAVPKRRTNRTASHNSVGSQGSQPTSGPLAGFSFGNASAPLTAAKPPVQPTTFNTGFGSPNITGFGNTNNTIPPTSTPTAIPGFGGFTGFGASNVTNTTITPSPIGNFGNTSTNPNPGFQTGFTNAPSNSLFSGFAMTGQQQQQQVQKPSDTPSPFGSFGSPAKPPVTGGFSFAAPTPNPPVAIAEDKPVESNEATPSPFAGFALTKPSTTTTTTPTTGFSFGAPAVKPSITPTETNTDDSKPSEKPSPFAGFGTPAKSTGFSFSTPSTKPVVIETIKKDELTKPSETPSPFAGFGAPAKAATANTTVNTGFSFAPVTKPTTTEAEKDESAKPSESPSPFVGFGTPAKSATTPAFSFGAPAKSTEAEKDETSKPSPFGAFGSSATKQSTKSGFSFGTPSATKPSEAEEKETKKATPSLFTSTSQPASSGEFSFGTPAVTKETKKDESTQPKETPSPFGLFGTPAKSSSTEAATKVDKPSPFGMFGTPAKSSTTEATQADKPSPFGSTTEATQADKPSPFGSTAEATQVEKPSPFGSTTEATKVDKPSPFGSTTEATKVDKPSPFGSTTEASKVNKPSPFGSTTETTKVDKPSPFGSLGTSGFSFAPLAVKPATEKNETNKEDTTDKPAVSKPFTFNLPSIPVEKPTADLSAKPFSINAPVTTKKSDSVFTHKKRQLERDDDEDGPSASKKTGGQSKPSPFGNTEPSKSTNFSFGTSNTTDKEGADKPSVFSFGKPTETGKETSKPTSSFSFDSSKPKETTDTAPVSKPFSFGTPATTSETSKTPEKPISFGAIPSLKTSEPSSSSTTTTTATTAAPISTKDKQDKEAHKKVTFGASTPVVIEAPGSANVAFSKVGNSEVKTSASLSLSTVQKDTTSNEKPVQTTLHSSVSEPSQITYKTCFWELPDQARNELALLANFITEQTDKHDKIAEEINSSFGPELDNLGVKALTMDNDAVILRKQLEVQGELLHDLIHSNKEQRLNAVAASNVQKQDTKNWRVRGASENWNFFGNTIEDMENKLRKFTIATESIEEAIEGFQKNAPLTPEAIGEVLQKQRKMYLTLAGRVAELHQEADRVIKRRKIN